MTKKTAKMLLAAKDVYGPIIKFAPVIYRLPDGTVQELNARLLRRARRRMGWGR